MWPGMYLRLQIPRSIVFLNNVSIDLITLIINETIH